MVLLVDNYDSFTYNLWQMLGALGCIPEVVRNDEVDLERLDEPGLEAVVVSPGPGRPGDAGATLEAAARCSGRIPLLGICLGHQAIGVLHGVKLVHAPEIVHGKVSVIHHDKSTIFSDVPSPFKAVRYHSLLLKRKDIVPPLEVSAWTGDGLVMGIRNREAKMEGVQFHPESVLTEYGPALLAGFLSRTGILSTEKR